MRALAAVAVLTFGALAAAATSEVEERNLRQAMGYAQRGLSSLQKGNVARARENFDRAVAIFPGLPDAHTGFGHLAMRERRFEDALREYKLAESGWKGMASVRLAMQSERFGRSRDELQQLRGMQIQLAQEINRSQTRGTGSSNTMGGSDSGQLQRQMVTIEARIRALEAQNTPMPDASQEPPGEVLFFQGNALFDLKRTKDAIAIWEIAAKELKTFAPLHNNLAVAYWMSGRLEDAWVSLRRAEALGFKVNPNFRADLEKAGSDVANRAAGAAGATP